MADAPHSLRHPHDDVRRESSCLCARSRDQTRSQSVQLSMSAHWTRLWLPLGSRSAVSAAHTLLGVSLAVLEQRGASEASDTVLRSGHSPPVPTTTSPSPSPRQFLMLRSRIGGARNPVHPLGHCSSPSAAARPTPRPPSLKHPEASNTAARSVDPLAMQTCLLRSAGRSQRSQRSAGHFLRASSGHGHGHGHGHSLAES